MIKSRKVLRTESKWLEKKTYKFQLYNITDIFQSLYKVLWNLQFVQSLWMFRRKLAASSLHHYNSANKQNCNYVSHKIKRTKHT